MVNDLSPRQREIYNFIVAAIDQSGICPSYREIGKALGIGSTNGVSDHIKALERKGFIERVGGHGASRSIRLSNPHQSRDADQVVGVPVLGKIAAGQPLLAVETYESTLRVDTSMLPPGGQVFALVVQGESMIEDGIFDGDYLFVRQKNTARDGEIAVVMVDGEATVKRFYREGERIRLQPANSAMDPIWLDRTSGDIDVVGIAVGVYRML